MEGTKLYYSMGEVAEMFDVNPSLIRYWETQFDVLRPKKNKKGNRMFTPQDVERLKLIYHLVKEKGMTLEGAKRSLRSNRGVLERDAELLERLERIRSQLVEVREELKGDGAVVAGEPFPVEERSSASDAAATESEASDSMVLAVGEKPQRKPRKSRAKKEREEEDKELFAFFDQSLF